MYLNEKHLKQTTFPCLKEAQKISKELVSNIEKTNIFEKTEKNDLSDSFSNISTRIKNVLAKLQEKVEAVKKIEERGNSSKWLSYSTLDFLNQQKQMLKNSNNLHEENSENNPITDYCSNTGCFSDFTEYQQIMMTYFSIFEECDPKYFGKTVQEIYDSTTDEVEKQRIKSRLIDNGFGQITLVESISGDDGFDAIVLQDKKGDYTIYYPGTDEDEDEDMKFDFSKIFDFLINKISGNTKFLTSLFGIDIYELMSESNDIYDSQVDQAQNLALKYLKIADKNSKKINFQGYSLGGALAEESYVYAVKYMETQVEYSEILKQIDSKLETLSEDTKEYEKLLELKKTIESGNSSVASKQCQELISEQLNGGYSYFEGILNYMGNVELDEKVWWSSKDPLLSELENYLKGDGFNNTSQYVDNLGEITLYNPYHAQCESSIEILTESGDLNLYCAEGDMVSSAFNYEEFYDSTTFVYTDYESAYEASKSEKVNIMTKTVKFVMQAFIGSEFLLGLETNELTNLLTNYSLIFSGAHKIHNLDANIEKAFDKDGSVKTITGTDVVDGVTFSEISKSVYGFDLKEKLSETIDITTIELVGGVSGAYFSLLIYMRKLLIPFFKSL
ncbi:MAG: hypothetical protein IJY25_05255 [Bacilli bacterium]|nr:hypothetical protein [Bacilli bacterium]